MTEIVSANELRELRNNLRNQLIKDLSLRVFTIATTNFKKRIELFTFDTNFEINQDHLTDAKTQLNNGTGLWLADLENELRVLAEKHGYFLGPYTQGTMGGESLMLKLQR